MREVINYKKYKIISIITMLIFIILFLSSKLLLIKLMDPELLNYRILPVIWCSFLFVFLKFIPKVHPIGRISMLEIIYLEAIVCAAVLTGIRFLAGSMIGEMGESPYILTPVGIMNNLLFALPPLIVREIVRSYVLESFCIKPNVKAFIIVTVVLTLCDVNYTSLKVINDLQQLTVYLAEDFGPLLCQHIMLSYLALYGGSVAALCYLGIITLFNWTSPILPVLNWLTEGAISILVPIFALMIIIRKYENRVNNVKQQLVSRWDSIQWTMTAVFSIGLIWFVIGVFPIIPSVVATGSMEPLIKPGDIVLLEKISSEAQVWKLKKGDIIQFQRDDIRITHRIVEVIRDEESGRLSFRTKGDNNSTADTQTVDPNDIKGIYVKDIPKLGYPTLLIKGHNAGSDKKEVEF